MKAYLVSVIILAAISCRKSTLSSTGNKSSQSNLSLIDETTTPSTTPGCGSSEMDQHRVRIQSAKDANVDLAGQLDIANQELALLNPQLQVAEYLRVQAKIRSLWDAIDENNQKVQAAQQALSLCARVEHQLPIADENLNPACSLAIYNYAEAVRAYENSIATAERAALALNTHRAAMQTADALDIPGLLIAEASLKIEMEAAYEAVQVAANAIQSAANAMGVACNAPSFVSPSPSIVPTSPAVETPNPTQSSSPSPTDFATPTVSGTPSPTDFATP